MEGGTGPSTFRDSRARLLAESRRASTDQAVLARRTGETDENPLVESNNNVPRRRHTVRGEAAERGGVVGAATADDPRGAAEGAGAHEPLVDDGTVRRHCSSPSRGRDH